jgi:hypothetical protein
MSDTADISVINTNMDTVDAAIKAEGDSIAIVQNGNTATKAIAKGEYVHLLQANGWLSAGLYKARVDIPVSQTLTSGRLDAVSDGGLNHLESNVIPDEMAKKANSLSITSSSDGTTHTLTLPAGSRGIIIHGGSSQHRQALLIYNISSTGGVTISTVYAGSYISAEALTNSRIKFTATSSYTANVMILDFANNDLSGVTLS